MTRSNARGSTCVRATLMALCTLTLLPTARAQSGRGTILKIDDGRAIVDLGEKDGLRTAQPVRVLKRYVLTHPVTGAKIEDELFLGEAKVADVGARIIAVELGAITKASVGDVVTTATAPQLGAAPSAVVVPCSVCRTDEVALAAHKAFLDATTRDAAGRREVWRRYLDSAPKTPYRASIERELRFLSSLDRAATPPDAIDPAATADTSLERLREGEPYALAVVLPTRLERHLRVVNLYYRRAKQPLFARLEMKADGDGYFRATVPGTAIGRPHLAYFVECVDAAGRRARVLASADNPHRIAVEKAAVQPDERRNRSLMALRYNHVDYYLKESGRDFYWRLDASYTYKVDFGRLTHFTLGFGFFEGKGGERTVVESSAARPLDALAFGFVYLQPEFELHELFAIYPRLTVGQIDRRVLAGVDAGTRTNQLFGFHGFMRIGKRDGTHLLVGAGSTQQAGFETQLTMNLGLWKRTPVAVSALVSNVPVGRELGLLLRASVGQRIGDFMELGMHLGFAARNIDHTGIDFGSYVAFQW